MYFSRHVNYITIGADIFEMTEVLKSASVQGKSYLFEEIIAIKP